MSDIEARPYSKDYEITDAMFGAFRSPGGASYFWTLFGWSTLLFSVIYLIALPPIVRGYIGMFGALGDLESTNLETNPEGAAEAMQELTASLWSMTPMLLVFTVGALGVVSVVRAAYYRRYFHNEVPGRFPFRLGADEGCQFLAQLGFWGLYMVAVVFGAFVMGIIVGVVVGVAGVSGSTGGTVIAGVFALLFYLGFYAFIIWFGVRLAPAGALTGLRRKVHVLAARKVSANRFWALLGSILVAGLIGYVTYYAMLLIGGMIGLGPLFSADTLEALAGENPENALNAISATTQTTGFRVMAAIGIIIMSAGQAFYTLILLGPSSFFVKQWDESDPTKVFA